MRRRGTALEYAWNRCAIVDHRAADRGYALLLNHLGFLELSVRTAAGWQSCTSSQPLPRLKWSHVAGTYQPSTGLAPLLAAEVFSTAAAFVPR